MSESKRLSERNAQIAKMLNDGERLKDFYRFTAQNPHIDLHDACQIVISRPKASVCFTFEEWNAMGRRINKGKKGVAFYDREGNKYFAFDANDTHGDKRYQRLVTPIKHLVEGLDSLNGIDSASKTDNYKRISVGVERYLKDHGLLSEEKEENQLYVEGITYSLYSKTGFPKDNGVKLHGIPYELTVSADLFKEINRLSESIQEEIEDAYQRKQAEVKTIDDTEENVISDEPTIIPVEQTEIAPEEHSESVKQTAKVEGEQTKNIVEIQSAAHSHYKGYVAFVKHIPEPNSLNEEIYLGKREHYDDSGHYDNTDNSLVFISNNPNMYSFLYGEGWTKSQEEMVKLGMFSEDDYKEFNDLQNGVLKNFEKVSDFKFNIDMNVEGSGENFRYPDWQDKKEEIKTQPIISPMFERYLDEQKKYPDAIVLYRLGDFYEVMGEKAVTVSNELDLTLTGRNVGLPERVPMCGFPYHVTDQFVNKLLEKHGVLVVDGDGEAKYIQSNAEVFGDINEGEQLDDDFSDEQSEIEEDMSIADDDANADDECTEDEIAEAMSEEQSEQDEDYGNDGDAALNNKNLDDDAEEFSDEEWNDALEEDEKEWEEANIPQPQEKKGKSIRDRKRKEKPQYSLFDIIDGDKEQTPEEKLTEWGLKRGSGISQGKFRIYDEYLSDPTTKEFADFLRNEYGTGGYSGGGESSEHNGKGIGFAWRDKEHPENDVAVTLNWVQAANGIADLIDDDNYFTDSEKETYNKIRKTRQELINTKTDEEQSENTNLSDVGFDQSELGGAKTRFKGNLEAIKFLNRLEESNRNPTADEQKILVKYVGWGGLAPVFDEANTQWNKEFFELKNTLSAQEYDLAKGSVLNAHFTAKEVIDGMYSALIRFGVKGSNKILEPAMGVGNFFGFMPQSISDNAKLYGVELDDITGKIATKLYPNAKIQIKGFEETSFENNTFDIVVGNVPFGGYSVYDTDYNRYNFKIHDYFIAKSIDKLKPNGIMAVITSKGTMDKLSPTARKYYADRAELLGAIRLPNTAFKQTAGTEAVTDILFFRKREERIYADISNTDWLSTGKTEEGFEINNYFIRHPEMVLGTIVKEHGLYGAIDVTVKPDGRELTEALNDAVNNLPQNFYTNPIARIETDNEEIEADYDVKPLNFKANARKLYMRVGDRMVKQTIPSNPKDAYERIVGMIILRNGLRNLLEIQSNGCSDEQLIAEQRQLNTNYDSFVRKYGYLNSQTNSKLFKDDGDSALLFACEKLSEDKKSATKEDIFSKRTIRPYSVPTSTDDCFEALNISKNERGKVDVAYVEELTKKDYDTVLTELGTAVFRNPISVNPEDKYTGFESAEEYLSGEVVKKLATAQRYVAEGRSEYETNVKALEQVQPTPLTASDISVRIGTSWIDTDYYKQFFCQLIKVPYYYRDGLELFFNVHDGSWKINKADYIRNYTKMNANEVYGTSRASAFRLFEDCLNLKATTIYDTVEEDGKEKRVLNQAETIAAREKQNKIKEAFKDWIFSEPERREDLEKKYNALFNQLRLPTYDGSYLKFPGMNPSIQLKPHQKNAVHRIITSGNTLLHHVVGSGKTFTICATIMKLRQYGLAKKPMIAVPNHLVQQWADEFRKLYPSANLLIASKEDLEKDKRQQFVSKVAMGDWDAVIIAQSSFAKINISSERQINKIREEIASIERSIESQWEDGSFPRGAVKRLESIKKGRETQLKKLLDESKKDNVLIFEKLGVDYLFIDEAHYFKNKFLYTKMNNVAGISTTASQRAADLELKVEYINELHGGDKGVVFATGTPISNSMTEMYTMQSYLQKNTLQELGLTYFDAWAADFGETVTSLEMAPSGQGYKPKTRFAKFTNLPELLTLYRSFADVQTSDMVKLDVPEAERTIVNLKPSETVIALAEEIADRAEAIHDGIDPHIDNMLKVTSDGKKLALDTRCFDPTTNDEEGSKLHACADRIYEIWERTKAMCGAQIVFCDLSTPKCAYEDYEYGKNFDVYNDLKYKLVNMGIPKEEIAFIHDANSDLQKQSLFRNVNGGKVRVLIGSTEKCGAGTNAQERLVALHHLDTPYRPSDMQQREGRIIRQGNINGKVQIFTYVTERTFDSYSYQILENKQRFISQIDRGDLTVREADDIDETTLTYAEIKAITAANPRIKRKMELDTEVARLRVLEGQYRKNLYSLQDKIRKDFPEKIRKQELYLERLREDMQTVKENYKAEVFTINVNGTVYTDKKEGTRALTDALYSAKPDTVVAEYGGLKISMNPLILLTAERQITLAGKGQYVIDIGSSAIGNMTRLDNFFADFMGREERVITKLEQLQSDLVIAEEQINVPFEHKAKLEELNKELTEINAELDLNKREEVIIDEENDETATSTEEQNMALPTETKRIRKQTRKPLKNYSLDIFNKQKAESPDSYIFVKNGSNYELLGDKAEEYAEEHDLSVVMDEIDGKKTAVLSLEYDKLDKAIAELVGNGEEVRIIEQLTEKREDSFLDENDKIEALQVDFMPDYTVNQNDMNAYGYEWNGMLPLREKEAKRLYELGLDVYRLYEDDTEGAVDNEKDFTEHDGLFGIEKPDWLSHLSLDETKDYYFARKALTHATIKMLNAELNYVQGIFFDPIIDSLVTEQEAYEKYLGDKQSPSDEKMKQYLPELLEEYADKVAAIPLEQYGWTETNVKAAIAENIGNEELKEYGKILAEKAQFSEFITDGLKDVLWLNGRTTELTAAEIGDLSYDLKPWVEDSHYASGVKMEEFDDWYDDFRTEKILPELLERRSLASEEDYSEIMEEIAENTYIPQETIAVEKNNVSEKAVIDLVRESVEKEYQAFYAEELKKTKEELINNSYKIHFYNELSNFLGEDITDNLTDRDLEALYTESPHILGSLYDYYIDGEYVSIENYADTADLIRYYNDRYHEDLVKDRYTYTAEKTSEENSAIYLGLDTENTAYYHMPEKLDNKTLGNITTKADGYVIASPVCYLSDEQKEKYHIFFLKIGRDIFEDGLRNKVDAVSNMQIAVDRINTPIERQIPIYYQGVDYAYSHGEQGPYNNSMQASRECIKAIGEAIGNNYKDNTLGKGFEDAIIEKYGKLRVDFVLATVIRNADWDERYSKQNREWAESIAISENEDERKKIYTNAHPGLVDLFANSIRKYSDKVKSTPDEQDKFLTETKQGFKVLSITKDDLGRDIAVIQRSKDFVVAAGYNVKDGSWAQGYYDFPTLKAAEKFREEQYGVDKDNTNKKKWVTVQVSRNAVIKRYEKSTFMRMPTTNEKYKGYTYNVFKNRIKDSRQLVDMESDGRELSYELLFPDGATVMLKNRQGDEIELSVKEFSKEVGGTSDKDYIREDVKKISLTIPREAMRGMYENSSLFSMPNGKYAGQSYYIPNAFLSEDENSDGENISVNIPEDLKLTVTDRKTNVKTDLTSNEYYSLVNGKAAKDYEFKRSEQPSQSAEKENNNWRYVSVDEAAKIAEYDERTLLKMPKGKYEGYCYYLSNGFLKENAEKGTIKISLPENTKITVKDGKNDKKEDLTPEQFIAEVEGKTKEDYVIAYKKPSETTERTDKFKDAEERLRKSIPEEMKKRPNWVILRTRENAEKGRPDKFLIDCHTGKFAESDNPETWVNFETACKYAHENGGETLAYALDGKDKICCIDVDDCCNGKDLTSNVPSEIMQKANTYTERSISGKGLHFFGKTEGMDLRTFSKNGDMEFYQKAHFIAMTGDLFKGSQPLASFDTPQMKGYLSEKCDKRVQWKGTGQKLEGLSTMSDRDLVEKACKSKHGETFKALYEGQDLQNNHSNSDMSLMNRLAYWCNGDKEQMLRIFATSGLFRPDKSISYYESTVIKALRDTTGRFQPQTQYTPKPITSASKSDGNSK